MRVAFLGLGIMGRPMAANLVKAGNEVAVWNRTPGKTVEGARTAESPADAANGAEAVWMCVSDTRAVEAVLFGPQGVESTIASGAIVVDSSTISPSAERQFAERLRAKGVDYVDAPVTGSKVAAESGNLIFMAGGDESTLGKLNPLFKAMGKQVFRMGETSKGQAAKLVMNLQIALIYEGFAEALTLAAKLGVNVDALLPLIQASMVKSGVVEYKAPFVLKTRFHAELSLAPHAEGYSSRARCGQGSTREIACAGNGGRNLRDGRRRWTPGSGLRRYTHPAGEMGGRGSERGSVAHRRWYRQAPELIRSRSQLRTRTNLSDLLNAPE